MHHALEDYLRLSHTRRVRPDEGARGESLYLASADELPGCESHGATADEALEGLEGAMSMYIESLLEDGLEPPIPSGITGPVPRAAAPRVR